MIVLQKSGSGQWTLLFLLVQVLCSVHSLLLVRPTTVIRPSRRTSEASIRPRQCHHGDGRPLLVFAKNHGLAADFEDGEHVSDETASLPSRKKTTSSSLMMANNNRSRRDWMLNAGRTFLSAATAVGLFPSVGLAAVTVKTGAAVCDPTVSVWTRGNRIIYLLGTAHISKVSADLAGQLVRDILPDAVFVELDLKRVGGAGAARRQRALMAQQQQSSLAGRMPSDMTTGSGDAAGSKLVVPVPVSVTTTATTATATTPSVAMEATAEQPEQPRGLRAKALNMGAAQIGNAIRGMYKNLDQQGFKPGEEFVLAVQEGQKVGADIVLGDQDVEITLRRLVQALQQTDLKKLTDPDSELEQSMKELLPGGGTDPNMLLGDKKELEYFVEAVKTRERVRKIMAQLKDAAPALVQVMLTERDAYMATGLNTLDKYETIVAVMGIAHVDGVEKNLRDFGWKQVKPRCPRR